MSHPGEDLHGHDLQPHVSTWHGFVRLLVYSALAVVVTLVLMAAFLL